MYDIAFLYRPIATLSKFLVSASPNVDGPYRLAKGDQSHKKSFGIGICCLVASPLHDCRYVAFGSVPPAGLGITPLALHSPVNIQPINGCPFGFQDG